MLKHYGIKQKSGRYPWGSGKDPQERYEAFKKHVDDLKKQGIAEKDIAKSLDLSVNDLRSKRTIFKEEAKKAKIATAIKLRAKGMSPTAIGKQMGLNESSVRDLLSASEKEKQNITSTTMDVLRKNVSEKKYIDIGAGVERYLGISRTKLQAAVSALKDEGYQVGYVKVQQLGTGKQTSMMVLYDKNIDYQELYKNKQDIKMVQEYSNDGGRSYIGIQPPTQVDSKRILIRYGPEGGSNKDGVIELRRGVEDLNLGKSKYAQVRVGVDGTHFLKGMAMHTDDIPDGYDIIYNTNKPIGTPAGKVFKEMKTDPDNPFGATVRQKEYTDKNGNKKLSALNVVNEEGDWSTWSKTLSSQVLSKQSPTLAKELLGEAFKVKKQEYDEIMTLTNPVIKKKLLEGLALDCDAAAVHMKAAAMPRQGSHVLLPFPTMKENEIYAPNYKNGEKVVLIRYPHGGIFEIPELTVNNKHAEANRLIGGALDAVGIHPKVAEKMSGADFDGDTALVIPNNQRLIKTSASLKGLIDFDPKISYPMYNGMKVISSKSKQQEMGKVSNLITDMTIKGATTDELAAAVRHSMVVIDSEKHKLNWKQSEIDNNVKSLKSRYQSGGASTIVSRAKSQASALDRRARIDPDTGKIIYEYTGKSYINKDGKEIFKSTKSTKMFETDDAHTLSSGTPIEKEFADHANRLKALANDTRKSMLATPNMTYNPEAKKKYTKEVAELDAALNIALKNAPLERNAQNLANFVVSQKKQDNPSLIDDKDQLKKIKGQELTKARLKLGAGKAIIKLTDKQWEAIQAGAISTNKLYQIINNSDIDKLKKLAMPKQDNAIKSSTTNKALIYLKNGKTAAEVAQALGVSVTTINNIRKENAL